MSRPGSVLGFPGRKRTSSGGSSIKVEAVESPKEKARYKINTKADPSRAIKEQEPAAQFQTDQTTITSLRSLEHRDADGNLITDPDASNPTRPRLERPLDTIRSFEAAIDGHNRRQSFRADSASTFNPQNRRSSYLNGNQYSQSRNMYHSSRGSYYGNRNSTGPFRSDDNGDGYGYHNNSQRFVPRNNSDPVLYGHHGGQTYYPSHGQQPSYDTVGTASNQSHATDQWGNSTDPSSENSSIDKVQPGQPKQDLGELYGFNGFGAGPQLQGPILEELAHDAPSYGQPGYGQTQNTQSNGYSYQGNEVPPAVPTHGVPRVPPKNTLPGDSGLPATPRNDGYNNAPGPVPNKREKRRSWFGKRLSKF